MNSHDMNSLIKNVHQNIIEEIQSGDCYLTKFDYDFYHYRCDSTDDVGYGCGYRTLQSIASLLKYKTGSSIDVPSIREIQEILVEIGDKNQSFVGSRDWIGSVEISYVLDKLFGVSCFLHHITAEQSLSTKRRDLVNYFRTFGGLAMMGGNLDASSKGIAGVHISDDDIPKMSLLVVDPHYIGQPKDAYELIRKGYVRWIPESEFLENSFYNFCMPKI